jgi:hypothetical protein
MYPKEFSLLDLETPVSSAVLPGEIWQIKRSPQWNTMDIADTQLLEMATEQQKQNYSDIALKFLNEDAESRYVLIIKEPQPINPSEPIWQVVTVLVLSTETTVATSTVDLLIPAQISGFRDLLAETWNVVPMLVCQLDTRVGNRLPRPVYDLLLDVGEAEQGSISPSPTHSEIQAVGLQAGHHMDVETLAFHQQELSWSDVITIPVALCCTYLKGQEVMQELLEEAIALERIRYRQPVSMQKWLQGYFEPHWRRYTDLPLAVATRSGSDVDFTTQCGETSGSEANHDLIYTLITQIESSEHEQQRNILKKLGRMHVNASTDAINAIVNVLQTATDDETIWTAVETLRRFEAEHPAAGIRRIQRISLGSQLDEKDVALAVSLLPHGEIIHIFIQVYPLNAASYLPDELKLILLDQSGQVLREVTAQETDLYLQLKLRGQIGEAFGICVALGEEKATEDFIL